MISASAASSRASRAMVPDPLGRLEVWLVTGSQDCTGRGRCVRSRQRGERSSRASTRSRPSPVRIVVWRSSSGRLDRSCCARGERKRRVHRRDRLDAHLLARADVDRRADALQKPLLHLHTQFNRDLPWAEIDMDYMNLNQSAHGDREFGFIRPACGCAQDRRRPLAGPGRRDPHRRLDARRRALARGAAPAGRPLRRQHARGGRHRGRQGRGADPARRRRSTATAWPCSRTGSPPFPTRRSTVSSRSTRRRSARSHSASAARGVGPA